MTEKKKPEGTEKKKPEGAEKKKPEAADNQNADGGILVDAAKAIGRTAGKVAAMVGVAGHPEPAPKAVRKGKLAPKNKSRLPRKQKKALARGGKQSS